MPKSVNRLAIVTPRIVSPAGVIPRVHMPSGAIATLAEARRCGYNVSLLDCTAEGIHRSIELNVRPYEEVELDGVLYWKTGITPAEATRMLAGIDPDVIGISCSTIADRGEVKHLASAIRKALPKVMLILGGYEASEWPEEILGAGHYEVDAIPEADFVVLGPGQPVIGDLLRYLSGKTDTLPAGLAFRTPSGTVAKTSASAFNPNEYALPAFDLLPSTRVSGRDKPIDFYSYMGNPHAGQLRGLLGGSNYVAYLPLYTSYGCGFSCTFCDVDKNLRRYSTANVEAIIASFSSNFGVDYVDLIDNNFAGGNIGSRRTAFEILDVIRALGLSVGFSNGLTFESMARHGFELLSLFADYQNVKHIAFPCENGNDRVLRMIRKPHTIELVIRTLTFARSHLGTTNREAFFIGGFPTTRGLPAEEPAEVDRTLSFMEQMLRDGYLHQAIFLTLSPITREYRTMWREKNPVAPFEHCLFSRTTSIWPYGDDKLAEYHRRAQHINELYGCSVTRRFNYVDINGADRPLVNSLW